MTKPRRSLNAYDVRSERCDQAGLTRPGDASENSYLRPTVSDFLTIR